MDRNIVWREKISCDVLADVNEQRRSTYIVGAGKVIVTANASGVNIKFDSCTVFNNISTSRNIIYLIHIWTQMYYQILGHGFLEVCGHKARTVLKSSAILTISFINF